MNTKPTLQISDAAATQLKKILEQKPTGHHLRITVMPGGCNGFEYVLKIDSQSEDDDIIFSNVRVDETSLKLIAGATLDYETSLGGAAFKIVNPLAVTACGCGNSFNV